MRTRTYSELCQFDSYKCRFEYLRLDGVVGRDTFGFDRWINQAFYTSSEWRRVRQEVIVRDNGCDLGIPGHEINGSLLVHHMNPMSHEDIAHGEDWILDPRYLITTVHNTHNAIHYGDSSLLPVPHVDRAPGDTKLW